MRRERARKLRDKNFTTDDTENTSFTGEENALVKNNAGLQIVDVETGPI
jgi:hypothetical protein